MTIKPNKNQLSSDRLNKFMKTKPGWRQIEYCVRIFFLHNSIPYFENTADSDQLASYEASWSGSTLIFHLQNDPILIMIMHHWTSLISKVDIEFAT